MIWQNFYSDKGSFLLLLQMGWMRLLLKLQENSQGKDGDKCLLKQCFQPLPTTFQMFCSDILSSSLSALDAIGGALCAISTVWFASNWTTDTMTTHYSCMPWLLIPWIDNQLTTIISSEHQIRPSSACFSVACVGSSIYRESMANWVHGYGLATTCI